MLHALRQRGILADVMGLGETLTMISAIVATINPSGPLQTHVGEAKDITQIKAAFVVASSVRKFSLHF